MINHLWKNCLCHLTPSPDVMERVDVQLADFYQLEVAA